jgi:prophage maintenance system killer protein
MLMFLGLNGHSLDASETEVVTTMLAVAGKRYSEKQLAAWVRRHIVRAFDDRNFLAHQRLKS